MSRGDDELADMLRHGQSLVRKGRAIIRAAENMGASADPATVGSMAADFGAIPGRSPEARAEALYIGRRLRDRIFPEGIFSEPAWDILLSVFLAQRKSEDADIDAALVECRVPRDAGLRFVALLMDLGLLIEKSDASEAPKRVALSASGLRVMNRFFELTEAELTGGMAAKHGRIISRSNFG